MRSPSLACAILLIACGVSPAQTNPPASTTQSAGDPKLDDTTRAKLSRPVTPFQMDGVDLEGCLGYLERVGGVRIVVPWDQIEAAGIDRYKPLSFRFYEGTVKNALNTTLGAAVGRSGVLSYTIKRGDIVVVVNARGMSQSETSHPSSHGNVPVPPVKKQGSWLAEFLKAWGGIILAIAFALAIAACLYLTKHKWATDRLRRRLFRVASVLSLMLCTASAVLWVQSYPCVESLSWTPTPTATEKRILAVFVLRGAISLQGHKFTRTQVEPEWDESGSRERWNGSGFEWRKGKARASARSKALAPAQNRGRFRWEWTVNTTQTFSAKVLIAEAPIWAVSVCLLILTLLFGWRGWRRRRQPNTCATCGYNLTGNSSGICPECGMSIPAKGVA